MFRVAGDDRLNDMLIGPHLSVSYRSLEGTAEAPGAEEMTVAVLGQAFPELGTVINSAFVITPAFYQLPSIKPPHG